MSELAYPWVQDPEIVLARTIYGENRDHGVQGMQSVANVVMNRVASGVTWWGHDVLTVCLAYEQFSVWNPLTNPAAFPADLNYEAVIGADDSDPDYVQALLVAREAIAGTLVDITNGADSYIAETDPQPWPSWATPANERARIGAQVFYKVA